MGMNKTFKFEIKEFGDAGTFEGLASTYGNVDLGGDVVEPGAFAKTIQDRAGEFPILWQHNTRQPIGIGKVSDSTYGLTVKGHLVLESATGREAYALLKAGVMKGLSIGYDTVREEIKGAMRHLKELKLYEISLVTFPMNELAMVTGVKADNMTLSEMRRMLDHMREIVDGMMSKGLEAPADDRAAQAPDHEHAAKQDDIAPELLHATSRISKLLRGEL